jgi:hypothetical protein
VIKARMAFLEEKGCVSWDISAAPQVGRELGVRYVLEGGLRKAAGVVALVRFAGDSPLEGAGFEPSVPVRGTTLFATTVTRCPKVRFVSDSLLEGDGFEPSVPRSREKTSAAVSDLQEKTRRHRISQDE